MHYRINESLENSSHTILRLFLSPYFFTGGFLVMFVDKSKSIQNLSV